MEKVAEPESSNANILREIARRELSLMASLKKIRNLNNFTVATYIASNTVKGSHRARLGCPAAPLQKLLKVPMPPS